RHPHLVQVLSTGELSDGSPYMAMEDLGESLDRRLAAGGEPLPWREVVQIARQVADALQALHNAGIVHRDVKPGNIAEVRDANKSGQVFVKLIDLGIARTEDEDLARVQQGGAELPPKVITVEGVALGTREFMAPESGRCVPDPRFDVYGLGASIFLLCTGELHDPLNPRSMKELRPESDIPEDFEALVMRALAVIPEERTSSAQALARQLAAISTGEESAPRVLFDHCYELIKLLGVGAKAEVYQAYHCDARRYVALKILREELRDNLEERLRFDREARVLGALDHRAIPALIDCRTGILKGERLDGQHNERGRERPLFIEMELRKGARVSDLDLATLSPEEVVEVGVELADALATMHEIGVIHRDLNRGNVLLERRDPSAADPRRLGVSLIDLGQVELGAGFYAATAKRERYPTPPEGRVVLGTGGLENLEWSAPETKQGLPWTAKSDVYSLGLMLYRLLTGKRPIQDSAGNWISPAKLLPDNWEALADAILGALKVDPKSRSGLKFLTSALEDAAQEAREIEEEEARMQEEAQKQEQAKASATASSKVDAAYVLEPVHAALDDARRGLEEVAGEIDGAATGTAKATATATDKPNLSHKTSRVQPSLRRWIIVGALACIGVGWLLGGTARGHSIASSAALARTFQRAAIAGAATEQETTPPATEQKAEDALADAATVQENAEGAQPAAATVLATAKEGGSATATLPATAEEGGSAAATKQEKAEHDRVVNDSKPSLTAAKASLRRARKASISAALGDLNRCLPGPGHDVEFVVWVARDGSVKKVSLDAPNLLSLAKKCIRRRLNLVRFKSGEFATKHRRRLGAKSQ
ncbi:MAG TPA: hypothetical protein ENJ18_14740, partial [Nannocystis exedens]|nr:hypothetical protein [Nannocystis exedens]